MISLWTWVFLVIIFFFLSNNNFYSLFLSENVIIASVRSQSIWFNEERNIGYGKNYIKYEEILWRNILKKWYVLLINAYHIIEQVIWLEWYIWMQYGLFDWSITLF